MEEKQKKDAKTRTSITIDPVVLEAARKHCEEANVSVSSFIETVVREALADSIASIVTTVASEEVS